MMRKRYNGPVWQDSYYAHRVVNTADYESQLGYIAANPARRHLVEYPYVYTQPEYEVDPRPGHLGG